MCRFLHSSDFPLWCSTNADKSRQQIVVCLPVYAAGLAISPCGPVVLPQLRHAFLPETLLLTYRFMYTLYQPLRKKILKNSDNGTNNDGTRWQ
jgi:hypothetical protein